MAKRKGRIPPDIELELLTEDFKEQLESGQVTDAVLSDTELPPLQSPRGQPAGISRCSLRAVTITDPAAQRLRMQDTLIDSSDLANIDLSDSVLERVEITSTRLTGARFIEAQLKDVLFRECKLDLIQLRMGRLQQCVFEQCNLADADFYGADLSGTVFRGCDFSRADFSSARLIGADIRDCRLDGLRGTPAAMEGLVISPDQAALLITLFGVRVAW